MAPGRSDPDDGGWFSFPRLMAVATGLTFSLILIGIYTAVSGAGLTCQGRWPLCDGWLGLFPANWPSFIEWFHRLIAMPTGFMLLGLTVAAWRGDQPRRVRYAMTAALAILPTQIILGGLTVTQYEVVILTAHFATAMLIFTLVTAATAWVLEDRFDHPHRAAAFSIAGLAPLFAVATPFVISLGSLRLHMFYYGIGLLAYGTLIALGIWVSERTGFGADTRRISFAAWGAAAALGLTMLQLRLPVSPADLPQISGSAALVAALSVLAAWWALQDGDAGPSGRSDLLGRS